MHEKCEVLTVKTLLRDSEPGSLLAFDFAALLALLSSHRWRRRSVSCRWRSLKPATVGSKLFMWVSWRRRYSLMRRRRRSKTSLLLAESRSPMLSASCTMVEVGGSRAQRAEIAPAASRSDTGPARCLPPTAPPDRSVVRPRSLATAGQLYCHHCGLNKHKASVNLATTYSIANRENFAACRSAVHCGSLAKFTVPTTTINRLDLLSAGVGGGLPQPPWTSPLRLASWRHGFTGINLHPYLKRTNTRDKQSPTLTSFVNSK